MIGKHCSEPALASTSCPPFPGSLPACAVCGGPTVTEASSPFLQERGRSQSRVLRESLCRHFGWPLGESRMGGAQA